MEANVSLCCAYNIVRLLFLVTLCFPSFSSAYSFHFASQTRVSGGASVIGSSASINHRVGRGRALLQAPVIEASILKQGNEPLHQSLQHTIVKVYYEKSRNGSEKSVDESRMMMSTMLDCCEQFMNLVGLSTKWLVAGSVTVALLTRRDVTTLTWVAGGITNGIISKVFKKVFNCRRPDGSFLSDPGMPSSHAMSLFFLGSYVIFGLHYNGSASWWPLQSLQTQLLIGVYAVSASLWRVKVGFHTFPQVAVGASFGSIFSYLWFYLCHQGGLNAQVQQMLGGSEVPMLLMISVCIWGVLGVGGFTKVLVKWAKTGEIGTWEDWNKYDRFMRSIWGGGGGGGGGRGEGAPTPSSTPIDATGGGGVSTSSLPSNPRTDSKKSA